VAEPELSFAGLLRQLRAEAKLTQEELAAAAGLSTRSVSDLERGLTRTARKDTAHLLAGALGLAAPVSELFVAAARGKAGADEVLAVRQETVQGAFAATATRALPRDTAVFTGRQAELAQLMAAVDALAADGGVMGIHAIDGMAGIGKTTFAVHAAHQLAPDFPDGQFFLPLHGHTAGQQPVDPADALASLLLTARVPAAQIPHGQAARAGRWRDQVAGKKILLLLDDAASHEQVRPLLPGTAGSLVLVTSRRRLTALEDAAVISLDTLPPGEAAALLARLARRPDLGPGTGPGGDITRLCGYLPLAIGMLASQLRHHRAWTAGQVAAELTAATDRLALMHAENLSVAAAFDLSYTDLTPGSQRLFRRLGLVLGPSFDAYGGAALAGTGLDAARRCLGELYDQHLIGEPAPGRYQLHDLLRLHARALAAADDPADGDAAVERLLDYYMHTALAAGQHLPAPSADAQLLPRVRLPECAPAMSTPQQAVSWLEAERANLQAAVGYAADCGRPRHAMLIPAAMAAFLDARGYWDQALAVHQAALAAARRAGDRPGQARALMLLSGPQFRTDDRAAAVAGARQALALYRDLDDRAGQAWALINLGFWHQVAGEYPSAAACHQQALELYRGFGERYSQAGAITGLGVVQQETGDYRAAAASYQQALELCRGLGDRLGQARALIGVGDVQRLTGDYPAATASYQQAQALNRDPVDRYTQAWIRNQLGVMQRLTGDYQAATASHQQALETLREIGELAAQGYVHNDLGLVRQLTGDYQAAAASHQHALQLMRDAAEPLARAYVLNSLGELASQTSATGQARDHHDQALAIARQIGAFPEEARALEGIGRSYLQDGNLTQGGAYLRQALRIYRHIGAPAARRAHETLHEHGLTSTSAEPRPSAPGRESHQPRPRTVP
jgi:tetratricopeptide (TPR) repeat protein/transcriptional regulator with XRE-family HTH domain